MKRIRFTPNPHSGKATGEKQKKESTDTLMDEYDETLREIEALLKDHEKKQQVPIKTIQITCPHCGKKFKK